MDELKKYSKETFEDIKHFTDEDIEFWYARELQKVLEYTQWRNFYQVQRFPLAELPVKPIIGYIIGLCCYFYLNFTTNSIFFLETRFCHKNKLIAFFTRLKHHIDS